MISSAQPRQQEEVVSLSPRRISNSSLSLTSPLRNNKTTSRTCSNSNCNSARSQRTHRDRDEEEQERRQQKIVLELRGILEEVLPSSSSRPGMYICVSFIHTSWHGAHRSTFLHTYMHSTSLCPFKALARSSSRSSDTSQARCCFT